MGMISKTVQDLINHYSLAWTLKKKLNWYFGGDHTWPKTEECDFAIPDCIPSSENTNCLTNEGHRETFVYSGDKPVEGTMEQTGQKAQQRTHQYLQI